MVTETTEKLNEVETPTQEGTPETEDVKTEVTEVEETGTKEPEPEVKPITFQTQTELDKHIEKQVQSLSDARTAKSMVTYQQELAEVKKQLKEATFRKEDDTLSRLEKSQSEDWGETQDVGDFQSEVRKLISERREFNQRKEEWDEDHQKATQEANDINAFKEALEILPPVGEEGYVSNLIALVEEIAGAATRREKDLIKELAKVNLKALAEAKPEKKKRTTPDSNLGSAPGGVDLTKLSARELLNRGYDKEK